MKPKKKATPKSRAKKRKTKKPLKQETEIGTNDQASFEDDPAPAYVIQISNKYIDAGVAHDKKPTVRKNTFSKEE